MYSLPLLALLFTLRALSSPLSPRQFNCRQTIAEVQGYFHFAPSWPTCANDGHLSDPFGSPNNVKVQPDCDTAIASACSAVDLMFNVNRKLYPVKSVVESCEVAILFSQQNVSQFTDYDAASCTTSLQSITETCMLVGVGEYAKNGQQAGVINLLYDSRSQDRGISLYPGPPDPSAYGNGVRFSANTACNDQPAYLVGSPNYFLDTSKTGGIKYGGTDVPGVAASSITRECLLADNCAIE